MAGDNMKCGNCGKFISHTESAKCQACNVFYHKGCVNLSKSDVIPTPWRCPKCIKNKTQDSKSNPPVKDIVAQSANQEPKQFTREYTLLHEELCVVRTELREFRAEMLELTACIKKCNERIDSLEARVVILEKQQSLHVPQVSGADAIIAEFRQELNARDQQLLLNDVEIGNLPESKGEDPIHLVKQIGTKLLDTTIDDWDIVSAERVGGHTLSVVNATGPERRPRPLVVSFARRALRDDLLLSTRANPNASTTTDMGMTGPPQRFYINERLTKYNRSLFRQAREAGRRSGWKFVWTKRGKVLARREPNDVVCSIRCEADIVRFFGTNNN